MGRSGQRKIAITEGFGNMETVVVGIWCVTGKGSKRNVDGSDLSSLRRVSQSGGITHAR